ncbi:hypothetical protein UFOVP696_116 [uncultured Caudovirales phage]|jgi:hypothetical protein|uniref:Uncharacterized protein n=1 Tax=uncultured Caudovirales phage TaxID=2100421 RepID=A0A6J5NMN2_9CAUD|nr:hypothetical protein UFOVP429_51 [uncultured Caudovirales phage]CAB4158248.1 hypothetical protein UFOVP696_116 [uncultured Caudovirales phage]
MNPINRAGNAVRSVGGYISNIAREVSDVPTAFGTNLSIVKNTTVKGPKDPLSVAGEKNVYKQVKEVGGAFLGKSGTRSDQYKPSTGYVSGSKLKK